MTSSKNMKCITWIVLLLFFAGCATFKTASTPEFTILVLGEIIEPNEVRKEVHPLASQIIYFAHDMETFSDIKWDEGKRDIKIKDGASFGLIFEVAADFDHGTLPYTRKFKHPEMIMPDGRKQSGYEWNHTLDVNEGRAVQLISYSLEEDYVKVAGEWTFEIIYNGETVISEAFTTYQ